MTQSTSCSTLSNVTSLSNSTPAAPQNAPLLKLPEEIIIKILTLLPAHGIGASAQLNRRWNQILKKDPVWRTLFETHFPHVNPSVIKNFQNAYPIHFNFTNGVYASHTLQELEGGLTPLAAAAGKLFVSNGNGFNIKIWDLKIGEYTAILQGHEDWVCSLVVAEEKLFSGSSDNTIKVWDINTGKCIAVLRGHEDDVGCLTVADGKLFSGSSDKTIKVWDLKTGEGRTLQRHHHPIQSLIIAEGQLFSFCGKAIRIQDITTKKYTTLLGHEMTVLSLAIADGKLFSGSADNTIKIWDIKQKNAQQPFKGINIGLFSLAVIAGTLFSGDKGGIIKVWDISTEKCTATLQGHAHGIVSLAVAEGKLFSTSHDRRLKVGILQHITA